MLSILRTILLISLRDRLFVALPGLAAAVLLVSRLLGSAALSEQHQAALAYGGMTVRLVAVLGVVVFVCLQVRRLVDSREIEAMQARPLSTTGLVLGLYGGFALAALGAGGLSALLLGAILQPDGLGWLVWSASLEMELALVTALALFAAISLGGAPAAALTSLAIYSLARLSSFFILMAQASKGWHLAMLLLSLLIPRLDMFTQSEWLVYGPQFVVWQLMLPQTVVFVILLLAATVYDLKGRAI